MISQLTVAPLGNTATPRRCTSCSSIATHTVTASRNDTPYDCSMPLCDRDTLVIRYGSPRLRRVG